jgi:GrpB-like predicted nucleotidyltransferase (UPF0157 family)
MADTPDADTPQVNSPTSEAYLRAVTIGERVKLNGHVLLAEYDPEWPRQFEALAPGIRAALGERVLLLEHAGSTAVPGLAAKPIIDMILVVADSGDEASYIPDLEHAGYGLRIREPGWFQHRLLKYANPEANLHVFSRSCSEVERMLLFRDWLRTHDDDRALYERTKRELAARVWEYRQHYADAKSDVVAAILARAQAAHEAR